MPARTLDVNFWKRLFWLDTRIAAAVKDAGCRYCDGPLYRSDYPRKPRGGPLDADIDPALLSRRISLCCGRTGCRRRSTPPSVRFLGRRVYLGAAILVAGQLLLEALGRAPSVGAQEQPAVVSGVPEPVVPVEERSPVALRDSASTSALSTDSASALSTDSDPALSTDSDPALDSGFALSDPASALSDPASALDSASTLSDSAGPVGPVVASSLDHASAFVGLDQPAAAFQSLPSWLLTTVPVLTLRRWHRWWQNDFVQSPFYQARQGLFKEKLDILDLPRSLLLSFAAAGRSLEAILVQTLRFLAPLSTSWVPNGSRFVPPG